MSDKTRSITIMMMYVVLLPGLFLAFSYLRTRAQSPTTVTLPLDSGSAAEVKTGPLGVGDISGSLVTVQTSVPGIRLQGSSGNYAAIGFDPNQQGTPFWYSSSANNQRSPFPLWLLGANPITKTPNVSTLNPLAVNTSTVVGSSSLVVGPAASSSVGVPVSWYVGGNSDKNGGITTNAAIMINAVSTSSPSDQGGSIFDWKWSDVNKDAPVAGLFMTQTAARGILVALADPLNLDSERNNAGVKLGSRWGVALQVDTNGDAFLGLASTTGAYVFNNKGTEKSLKDSQSPYYVDCKTVTTIKQADLDNPVNFFVPPWITNLGGAPGSIFPLASSYIPGRDEICFQDKDETNYIFLYEQYAPASNAKVFAASVKTINPTDVSGWDTMSTSSWEALTYELVEGQTKKKYIDPATGERRVGSQTSLESCQLRQTDALEGRFLESSCKGPANGVYSTIIDMSLGAYDEKYGGTALYDGWALCPNGYFVTAMKWSRQCTRDGAPCGWEPAIKCGRAVGWGQP